MIDYEMEDYLDAHPDAIEEVLQGNFEQEKALDRLMEYIFYDGNPSRREEHHA